MYIKSLFQSNSVCFLVWFFTFHICIILILITSYLNVVSDKTQDVDIICLLTNMHSLSVLLFYTVLSYLLKHAFIIMRRLEVLYIYSRLSLSRNRRDPLKHFEISVLRHIRFIVLRKKIFEQPHFTNDYVI